MARFSDGDRAAFDEVFAGLWPILLAVTRAGLPDPRDAEEAAQTALLKLFERIVDLDPSRDGVAWAATIAAWEVRTTRQRIRRRHETTADPGDVRADDDPEQAAIEQEILSALTACIGALSTSDAEIITRALSGERVSGETGRKQRFRAVQRLKDLWRRWSDGH